MSIKSKTNNKPKITLIPKHTLRTISTIMTENSARHDKDGKVGYREVPIEAYLNSIGRHLMDVLDDPRSVDESGHLNVNHLLTDVAILNELIMEMKDIN